MRLALIACRPTPTNGALCRTALEGSTWEELTPQQALAELRPGDGALGRLDVLRSLDGIDDGLWALGALAGRGVYVLNHPAALLSTHDKLLTARILHRHDVPHPRTVHVRDRRDPPSFTTPVVVKPRFGSWGSSVHRCDDADTFAETLACVADEGWFRAHGALVQHLVEPQGYDLRILVAAGRVVGAVHRIASPGEWRTNVNLGAVRRPVEEPPNEAAVLALAAARAVGADLVGVDLLPKPGGGWVVIELNGAVEFTSEYAAWCDVFADVALLLQSEVVERRARASLTGYPPAAVGEDGFAG